MEPQLGVDAVPFPVEVAPLGAFGAVDPVIDWLNSSSPLAAAGR